MDTLNVSKKTKIIILVIVVLLLAGGAAYYFKQKEAAKEKEQAQNTSSMAGPEAVELPKEPAKVAAKVVDIQQQKADASTSKKVLEVADDTNKPA